MSVCRVAKVYGTRPSKLLNERDTYTAYCLDEAGAWLLAQKDPPRYGGEQTSISNNPKLLAALAQMGGAAIKGTTPDHE